MHLDLNNVDSIVAWWQVFPERHDSYLDYKLRVSPEFAFSINAARRRIATSPELRALSPQRTLPRHSPQTWHEKRASEVLASESSYCEFAMD